MSTAPANPTDFREAVEWFGTKVPMTRDAWNKLATDARKRAFTVAHVAHAELVRGIHDSLSRAIAQGQSFDEWKQAAAPEISAAWGSMGTTPWHLETIFRANVQSAYGAGRYAQLTDPDMLALRPYWVFDSIKDSRTTDECRELNGTVMPANDPWWDGRIPPLHYNCRSSIRSLRRDAAEKQAKFNESPPEHQGAKGFGGVPMVKESELKVDLTRYPGAIAPTLSVQLSQDPNVLPLPLREPPVGMVGPAHGPLARRGGQWEPGYVRTDVIVDPRHATPPSRAPWHQDEELRSRGTISAEKGARKPYDHEAATHDYLAHQGASVIRLKEWHKARGGVNPDISIDGVDVELTSVSGKSVGNALVRKSKKPQADFLIIDARPSGLSHQEVMADIGRGKALIAQMSFRAIRIIGRSFDVTIYP